MEMPEPLLKNQKSGEKWDRQKISLSLSARAKKALPSSSSEVSGTAPIMKTNASIICAWADLRLVRQKKAVKPSSGVVIGKICVIVILVKAFYLLTRKLKKI